MTRWTGYMTYEEAQAAVPLLSELAMRDGGKHLCYMFQIDHAYSDPDGYVINLTCCHNAIYTGQIASYQGDMDYLRKIVEDLITFWHKKEMIG